MVDDMKREQITIKMPVAFASKFGKARSVNALICRH
jgi:hypothetical protein